MNLKLRRQKGSEAGMGWGWGEAGTKKRPGGYLTAEGARRAESGEKEDQGVRWEGARTAEGLGPWAGRERSEAWAGR